MKASNLIGQYWDYYLNIESDFISTQRYVTIDKDNYYTFSVEYVKQYQTICSEIDVFCKQYCNFLHSDNSVFNILGYANIILCKRPDIKSRIVRVNDSPTIILKPWEDWNSDPSDPLNGNNPENISPDWWTSYNKVKHNRTSSDKEGKEFFKKANLFNTMNALAGLFVLEMYFYKDLVLEEKVHNVTIPSTPSKIFKMDDWEKHLNMIANGFVIVDYDK